MLACRYLRGASTRWGLRRATPHILPNRLPTPATPLNLRPFSKIVHESPHPDVKILNKTVCDVVGDQLSVNADKPAFIDGIMHERVTFNQLHERARKLAVALAKDGVKKGMYVAIPENSELVRAVP